MDQNLDQLRLAIITQAELDGWLEFSVPNMENPIRVPRGAFEQWSVHHSNGGHLATPWKPISPVGIKQGADDPFHTDWMLGAGLQPWDMKGKGNNPHWRALADVAYAEKAKVEIRLLDHEASVLLGGKDVLGRVIKPLSPEQFRSENIRYLEDELPPVVIIRNASAEWLEVANIVFQYKGAVIVERGGEMAHLITELRSGQNGPLMRVDNAKNLYPADSVVLVSANSGVVRLMEFDGKPAVVPVVPVDPIPETKTALREKFTLLVRGDKAFPGEEFDFVEFGAKVIGRNYQAYSRVQFKDKLTQTGVLSVFVSELGKTPKERKTIYSPARVWKVGEISQATAQALLLLHPEESYDSPESQKIRHDIHHRVTLEFHEKVKHLSDEGFMELIKRDVVEFNQERQEGLDAYDEEQVDILESYRDLFKKYDNELKFRGLTTTVCDLKWDIEKLELENTTKP
jgi:hypothetical protein